MKVPQIIMVVLIAANLLATAHMHGKPRGKHNFWTSLLGTAINVGLLWWGGFFGVR